MTPPTLFFWLVDHPILGQVATLRSFQLESILECPALDVRQLVRNKKRKEYNSHTNRRSKKKKLGPSNLNYRGIECFPLIYAFRENYIFLATQSLTLSE